ncbi:MAG: carboxypeptidase regulatory-like domain-containing protein [Planctomycetota bacterium]
MKRGVAALVGLLGVLGLVWLLWGQAQDGARATEGARDARTRGPRVAAEATPHGAPEPSAVTTQAPATASTVGEDAAALEPTAPTVYPDAPPAATPLTEGGLQGLVLDPQGRPAPGVTVEVLHVPGEVGQERQFVGMKAYLQKAGQWEAFFQGTARTTTGPDGRFRVEPREGSTLAQLRFEHPAYVAARTDDFDPADYPVAGATFGMVEGATLVVQALSPHGEPVAAQLSLEGDDAAVAVGSGSPLPLHVDRTHVARQLEGAPGPGLVGEAQAAQAKLAAHAAAEAAAEEGAEADDASPVTLEVTEVVEDTGPRRLTGLAPGRQTLTARATGYATGELEVDLIAGEEQAVEVRLSVGLELRGRVLDPGGRPIPEAQVTAVAYSGAFDSRARGSQGSATSDADGAFAVPGLEDARYMVFASAEGYTASQEGAFVFGGKGPATYRPGKDEVQLTLQPTVSIRGRVRGVDEGSLTQIEVSARRSGGWQSASATAREDGSFELADLSPGRYTLRAQGGAYVTPAELTVRVGPEGASGVELALERGATLDVVVVAAGQPLANVALSLDAGGAGVFGASAQLAATTDAEGRAQLSPLGPGEYTLEASHADYAPRSVPLAVGPQGAGPLRIELKAGGTLRGRALEADGTPLVGQIMVTQRGTLEKNDGTQQGELDAEGAFEVGRLASGDYDVHFMDLAAAFNGSARIVLLGSFSVRSGETVTREFRCEPEAEVGALQGVLLQGSEPVAGRMVQARSEDGTSVWGGGLLWVNTDEEGRFEHTSVRPGRYVVSSSGTGEVVVDVRGGATAQVELRIKQGVIAGRVVDQLGAPLSGARVHLRPFDSRDFDLISLQNQVTSDASGGFSIDTLPPGRYVLAATGLGLGSAPAREVTLGDGQSLVDLELRLEPSPEVHLQVLGEDGAPLQGAEVSFYAGALAAHSAMLDLGSTHRTGPGGELLLDELVPGDYVFAARSALSGVAASGRVHVGPGDDVDLTLRLQAPGSVEVAGPPQAALRVRLADAELPAPLGMSQLFSSTSGGGQATLSGLPAGRYVIEATAPGGEVRRWEGAVPAGGTVRATLQ